MRPSIPFLTTLLTGALALAACGGSPGVTTAVDPSTEPPSLFVASDRCPTEETVVRRALDASRVRADVDGDGRLDTVAVAADPEAEKPCRAFVGVHLQGGPTYSTHLVPDAAPLKGLGPRIVALPDLAPRRGAEIVVDTRAAVDAVLAQLFTLTEDGLHAVAVPVFDDGTFIVEGGGVVYPHGAGCTQQGRLLLSTAAQTRDGERYRVVRRTYEGRGERLILEDPQVQRQTIPVDELASRYPEFAGEHWDPCTRDEVR